MTGPRRRLLAALAAAVLAIGAAGCGGGGNSGSDDAPADGAAGSEALPLPGSDLGGVGAQSEVSASAAVAMLGSPGAVDPTRAGATVGGYERFGTPKDVFVQQVRESSGAPVPSDSPPPPPPPPPVAPPVSSDPLTGTPLGTTPTMPTVPTTPTVPTVPTVPTTPTAPVPPPVETPPAESPVALEADFDIGGEPLVAREGDVIPPDTQQFTVKTIGRDAVVLQLNAGLLPDGSDTVQIGTGESITLVNRTAGQTYKILLVEIRAVS